MNASLFSFCVYTIRRSQALADDYASGGRGEFIERSLWTTGLHILQEARQNQQRVAVLFAPAESIVGVTHWALIDDIDLMPKGTKIRFSSLQPLPRKHRLSSLKKRSNGTPLSNNYIRPYVPCETPSFLFALAAVSTLAESGAIVPDIEADEIYAREGAVSTRQHLHRERDRTIIAAKRRQVLSATGRLACSVCGFDFCEFYGELGADFCEVHHLHLARRCRRRGAD